VQRIQIRRQSGVVTFDPADQMVDITTDGGGFIFQNDDAVPHQPQPAKGTWVDHPIEPGQPSTLITAQTPGAYPYTCALHSGEQGVVTAPYVITIQTELIDTGFNPAAQQMTPAKDGGFVVFLNLDQNARHHPAPDPPVPGDPNAQAWFKDDIAPGAYSPVLELTAPGTYHYHCTIHPDERGAITVKAPSQT